LAKEQFESILKKMACLRSQQSGHLFKTSTKDQDLMHAKEVLLMKLKLIITKEQAIAAKCLLSKVANNTSLGEEIGTVPITPSELEDPLVSKYYFKFAPPGLAPEEYQGLRISCKKAKDTCTTCGHMKAYCDVCYMLFSSTKQSCAPPQGLAWADMTDMTGNHDTESLWCPPMRPISESEHTALKITADLANLQSTGKHYNIPYNKSYAVPVSKNTER
jgi:hypothetical protein